jgi:hypothetical protein
MRRRKFKPKSLLRLRIANRPGSIIMTGSKAAILIGQGKKKNNLTGNMRCW